MVAVLAEKSAEPALKRGDLRPDSSLNPFVKCCLYPILSYPINQGKHQRTGVGMEQQFVLRVPPSVSERIECLLNDNAEDGAASLDVSFSDDGRSGAFVIGNERFPASLLDLPCIVESYKTYDDNVLIKTADIGQVIMVREEDDPAPEGIEYRHGLTPPMRDARRRRFRREPDLNPELVKRVEKDLLSIMSGGTGGERSKAEPTPAAKPDATPMENAGNAGEPERSESDDSMEPEES